MNMIYVESYSSLQNTQAFNAYVKFFYLTEVYARRFSDEIDPIKDRAIIKSEVHKKLIQEKRDELHAKYVEPVVVWDALTKHWQHKRKRNYYVKTRNKIRKLPFKQLQLLYRLTKNQSIYGKRQK